MGKLRHYSSYLSIRSASRAAQSNIEADSADKNDCLAPPATNEAAGSKPNKLRHYGSFLGIRRSSEPSKELTTEEEKSKVSGNGSIGSIRSASIVDELEGQSSGEGGCSNFLAPPTSKEAKLRHQRSLFSLRRDSNAEDSDKLAVPASKDRSKTLDHKLSFLSIRSAFSSEPAIPRRTSSSSSSDESLSISTAPTTPLNCNFPSPSSLCSSPPTASPPSSTSEYRWNFLPQNAKGTGLWWRTVDSMANFILHWQTRFHQHGDMFGSCTLSLSTPSAPLDLTEGQLREAIRRLRWNHPTVALRLAKRVDEGIEKLEGIPEFIASKVDLQVALVYDVVLSESDVEAWLDDVLIMHTEDRIEDEEKEFSEFLSTVTKPDVPGRDRLRIHYWPSDPVLKIDARIAVEQCHSVSEGIGTLLVFDLLLASIASVLSSPTTPVYDWGKEVSRLEPALQDAIASSPPSWEVTKEELKQVEKVNQDRMNGKSTPPNLIDRLGAKVVALTLDNHSSSNAVTRVVNKPLIGVCRNVAEKGDMLPLGLLPQTGLPYQGEITNTALITESLKPSETRKLLSVLRAKGLTLAPLMEAISHMATMWVRKHRQLSPSSSTSSDPKLGWDNPTRILGSFSNAISKRNTLLPEHQRYLGLCMSGFPTKISASIATWSTPHTIPSPTDSKDFLPYITPQDLQGLWSIAKKLKVQYVEGRDNQDWLRWDKALMYGTMQTEYLFLRGAEHYPSMPWLSSIGRVENCFSGSHPLHPLQPTDTEEEGRKLEAHNLRIVGRVGIRQPILHVYTFREETKIQFSFAEWLYNNPSSDGKRMNGGRKGGKGREGKEEERQNILVFWMQVYRRMLDAVLSQDIA